MKEWMGEKPQRPNLKQQIPITPISKFPNCVICGIGDWNLMFVWDLIFEIWVIMISSEG
jgi:hypothetical protein